MKVNPSGHVRGVKFLFESMGEFSPMTYGGKDLQQRTAMVNIFQNVDIQYLRVVFTINCTKYDERSLRER